MTPDINFESLSYNPFSIWENSINSEHYPDINFYQDSSSLETYYWSFNDFNFKFSIVCFSETRVDDISFSKNSNLQLSGYEVLHQARKIVREEEFVFLCMKILALN